MGMLLINSLGNKVVSNPFLPHADLCFCNIFRALVSIFIGKMPKLFPLNYRISPDNNCQFLSPPGIKVISFFRLVFSYIGLVKSETV